MPFFSPKTWKQRIVEFPGRRRLDDTSTADVYDVSRAEGNITQEGDGFTAANMNDLEQRITEGFQNVQNKTDELTQNMLRVATFNMTLTYSSANVLMASVDHNLGVTPRACIAQISSTDGSLRDFGYVLNAGATSGIVTAYAYSASKWSSGDSVEVEVAAFY